MQTDPPAAEPPALGPLLRGLRTRAGLSQEELSHRSGISVRAVADLERGRARGPQRRTVQALAQGLGLDEAGARQLEQAASPGRSRPHTARPAATTESGAPGRPVRTAEPRTALLLPRAVADFVGRDRELAEVSAVLDRADAAHAPVVLVCGQPGLGKTAFAVHAAYRLAERFPDGQYSIDLLGMAEEPTSPHEALGRVLSALGVPAGGIPAGTEARSGLFRTVVRDLRAVFVLDNAADEEQIRPLLPGAGRCLTIVTGRRTLAGLEAVHRIELALLQPGEAVELLGRILGPQRVGEEQQAAHRLAELCGQLPLAVRIAGQRLAGRADERLGKMAVQLAREDRRLDLLQAGTLRVRNAFELSYRQLSPPAQVVLRRAALTAGVDFSLESAARLARLPLREAALHADELVDAGLLQPHASAERYRFHDLLKVFAGERLAAQEQPSEREAALDSFAQWLLARTRAAASHFDAKRRHDGSAPDPDPATAPTDRESAKEWLEAEQAEWQAALHRLLAIGRYQEVIATADAVHWFAELNQHWDVWAEVFRCAAKAAEALGRHDDQSTQLTNLAWSLNVSGDDPGLALAAADAASAVARSIEDPQAVCSALAHGATALHRLGRVSEAMERLRQAAELLAPLPESGARLAELFTLNTLGRYLREAGRAEEALEVHRRSDAICRAGVPGKPPELMALYRAATSLHLGNDLVALARWPEAEPWLREALAGFEPADMPTWTAPSRLALGRVLARTGRPEEARRLLRAAHTSLAALRSPQEAEAAAELAALDRPDAEPAS
ncbi:Helix-turn-helix domain-containing protein [Kitasatospora sp. MMS16-BH015]|uniref:ATP-binding protein n=1 Tax=Kitasatospora sp. MMS16-BH015 TaxID=2018025 RepID=UPI000CA299D0|nr:tetratricopeptide repeat protein [Kitasatospora sp. MMS16-BH015]AUG80626.1 Helix-turn-helix domain-containing protein [Kitasatospora sp. MMS16-BH015]